MAGVYRAQPWDVAYDPYAYEKAYEEYVAALRQMYTNQAQGIYNTMADQNANLDLTRLGYNFADTAGQQALQAARMQGDIGELGMRQQQARNNMLLDMDQLRFQREQQRKNMEMDIAQNDYRKASTEVQSPFMRALRVAGY